METHVGVYPVYAGPPEFEAKIRPYRDKKDTLRFELRDPIPYDLIEMVARFKAERARSEASASKAEPERRSTRKRRS